MKRTAQIDIERHATRIAQRMRARASRGSFDGLSTKNNHTYMRRCTRTDKQSGTNLIYTRDVAHHTSGWFKNPLFERCRHLSISPLSTTQLVAADGNAIIREIDRDMTKLWLDAFFKDNIRLVWAESPKSPEGRMAQVWHWRLFCDEHWKPIHPKGEVYSTELTKAGWRSASQVLEEDGIVVESSLYPG